MGRVVSAWLAADQRGGGVLFGRWCAGLLSASIIRACQHVVLAYERRVLMRISTALLAVGGVVAPAGTGVGLLRLRFDRHERTGSCTLLSRHRRIPRMLRFLGSPAHSCGFIAGAAGGYDCELCRCDCRRRLLCFLLSLAPFPLGAPSGSAWRGTAAGVGALRVPRRICA